ncbi:type-1 angiotensin II receptor-associated protein-like isoform X1 [Watersipora subatra]|uniref:type-1 angiotensin II receptor-associated protein-like isoform X1 n=1 Tax=Watersipora subatra TaxID=2589382 RepID=UPI00355C1C6C
MDRIVYGTALLRIVVMIQIVFSTWGYLQPPGGSFMPPVYEYTHLILILFAAFSLVKPNSVEAVFMYLFVNIFTILNDIILLGLYQPITHILYEKNPNTLGSTLNTYRFALGMSIVNLVLKPVVCLVLFKVYQARGGDIRAELMCMQGTENGRSYNGYNSMDDSYNVETASPHHSMEHSSSHT